VSDDDLSITIQIHLSDYDAGIADCDDAAVGLVSEGRKIVRKMLAANERGAQERQFCSGAVRVAVTGGAS